MASIVDPHEMVHYEPFHANLAIFVFGISRVFLPHILHFQTDRLLKDPDKTRGADSMQNKVCLG